MPWATFIPTMRWVMMLWLPGASRTLMIWPGCRLLACSGVTGLSTMRSPVRMTGVIDPESTVITGWPKAAECIPVRGRWPAHENSEGPVMP